MTPTHRPFDSRMPAQGRPRTRSAFTLIEMLVVIGIITLLAAILIPVVSQVRLRASVAQTQGEMMRIMSACQTYYHDWNAYPGPLADNMLQGTGPATVDSKISPDPQATQKPSAFDSKAITSSENLVFGLLGLLSPVPAYGQAPYYSVPPPKHDVMSLNYTHPATYHYIDFLPDEIPLPSGMGNTDYFAFYYALNNQATGKTATDWNSSTNPPNIETVSDSVAPEFVDHIPNPMPILYLRANRGVPVVTGSAPTGIVSKGPGPGGVATAQYDCNLLAPYGFLNVKTDGSVSDFPPPPGVTEPSTLTGWWTYFMNPGLVGEPRGKDTFILIDAGPDRLYGTKDDIIVTP